MDKLHERIIGLILCLFMYVYILYVYFYISYWPHLIYIYLILYVRLLRFLLELDFIDIYSAKPSIMQLGKAKSW